MSDPFDQQLHERLERLSAAIPVAPRAPGARQRPRRRPMRAGLLAAALVLLVSLGATATYLALNRPTARNGAFAEGGPLHCSGVDQLSPVAAERWLTDHGLTATWQVEDRSDGTSTTSETPPTRGSIIDALALGQRTVLVLVDLDRDEPLTPRPCP